MEEKYGSETTWRAGLRKRYIDNEGAAPYYSNLGNNPKHFDDINKKNKNELVINARMGRGAGHPDVSTGIKDDRTRRIEIVRKTEAMPVDLDFNEAQENKLRIFKAKEEKVYKPVQSMPILRTQKDKLKQQLKRKHIPKQLE